jgi:hypothetical protein
LFNSGGVQQFVVVVNRPGLLAQERQRFAEGYGMERVYIANFGEGNSLWPVAKANNTIITIDNVEAHSFWTAGDRDGYIATVMAHSLTARGVRPERQTAGRWYNLMSELRATEGDIWISRQGESLWWTVSVPGDLRERLQPSNHPAQDGPDVWWIEKPCRPWTDKDGEGRPLSWKALHLKARDFLATEATFQTIANDRGYADYARALVAGAPLASWEATPLFVRKQAEAKTRGARIFSPRERAAVRMAATMLNTVAQANGQMVEQRLKEKTTTLSRDDCETLLRQKMGEQQDRCALTGMPLGYDGECEDKEMLASLDRINSSGHYTPDNVQLVCRFINRWKGADDDALVRRLITAVQGAHPGIE